VTSLVDEVERVLRSLCGVWDEAKDPAAPVPGLHWALDAVRRMTEQRARGRHPQPRGAGA
jgi:hypothetical protein